MSRKGRKARGGNAQIPQSVVSGHTTTGRKFAIDNCSNESGRSSPRKVGVVCVGGGGVNVAVALFMKLKASKNQNIFFMVLDADLATLTSRLLDSPDHGVQEWLESGRVFAHQLGGKDVACGSGAGADPEQGAAAARTENSKAFINKFWELDADYIGIGTTGGGVGAGALPVVAQLAKDAGKTFFNVAIMPDAIEQRGLIAMNVLEKLRRISATLNIENTFLPEFLAVRQQADGKRVTTEGEGWELINGLVIVRLVGLLLKMMSFVADRENLDVADWRMAIKYAVRALVGWYEGQLDNNEDPDALAEAITARLLIGEFQDVEVLASASVVLMWFEGKWPLDLKRNVQIAIMKKIANLSTDTDVEFHKGSNEQGDGENLSVSIVVLDRSPDAPLKPQTRLMEESKKEAGNNGDTSKIRSEVSAPKKITAGSNGVSAATASVQVPAVAAGVDRQEITFLANGKFVHQMVESSLAARFLREYSNNRNMSRGAIDALCDEVQAETGGKVRPDLPERFLVREKSRSVPQQPREPEVAVTRPPSQTPIVSVVDAAVADDITKPTPKEVHQSRGLGSLVKSIWQSVLPPLGRGVSK